MEVTVISADGSGQGVLTPDDKIVMLRTIMEVNTMIQTGTSFTAMLYRLMHKADQSNWKILSKAYPKEATEYYRWLKQDFDKEFSK